MGRALGRSSYATFLLHPIVLVLFSLIARDLPLDPELEFFIVAGIGVPASFGVGWPANRLPFLTRVV